MLGVASRVPRQTPGGLYSARDHPRVGRGREGERLLVVGLGYWGKTPGEQGIACWQREIFRNLAANIILVPVKAGCVHELCLGDVVPGSCVLG